MTFKVRVPFERCDGQCCEPLQRCSLLHFVGEGCGANLINFPTQGFLHASFKLETLKSIIHKHLEIFCTQGLWLKSVYSMPRTPLVNFLLSLQGLIP
ncbi:unnamed protein product [Prunus armeniaca]